MRVWVWVVLAAGCARATPPGGEAPLFGGGVFDRPPEVLQTEQLPGEAGRWPMAVPWSRGSFLLSYALEGEVRARLVEGEGREDLALGPGAPLGAVALDDGFAVVAWDEAGARVEWLGTGGERRGTTPIPLQDATVSGVASDGRVVALAATHREETEDGLEGELLSALILVAPDAVRWVPLGVALAAPVLHGDPQGFIVGTLLVDASGGIRRAPASPVAGVRLFLREVDGAQEVTREGRDWRSLPGPLRRAFEEPAALWITVEDGQLLRLDERLGLEAQWPAPEPRAQPSWSASWIEGARGRVLWAGVLGSDRVFSMLERDGLRPMGPWVRLAAPSSHAVIAQLGERDALFAWLQDGGTPAGKGARCVYARWAR